jgi:hypothetical protein
MDRARIRASFERRFSVERMTADYVALYNRLVATRASSVGTAA